ncbi:MAG: protein-L-isoaspartate(D-aspartate) O-methyltransferase [Rhodopseudomonas palustris]|uniref:Protein-L-isoaspartate O-methyltransferase n=1 Tax=Rhodopseudomonas palustris TaxID=1076 RepID=A0A933S1P8_RHOPL|nr:protein-L-isoaspartate(D-aspartate) O-methyltransferase [Rhodopseudomonas palustris]
MASPGSEHPPVSDDATSFNARRESMIAQQISARGVRDPLVLAAMRRVPREAFLPERTRDLAYDDSPLPIGCGQTISQPYIVAAMVEALQLKGGEHVLEIGAGSGYAAAVLAAIAGDVVTVERIGALADKAAAALASLGLRNVQVHQGDGSRGWPEGAPYEAIVVAAGGPQVPESLKAQLAIGGRLVMPVGSDQQAQRLVRLTRTGDRDFRFEHLSDVRFVPLIGDEGWTASDLDQDVPAGTEST